MMGDNRTINVEPLQIQPALKKEVKLFCEETVRACESKIISITVMGSAAGPDFLGGLSDVNILVVFSQLDLQDLNAVAPKARVWWRRSKLSPRFISKNNIFSSLEYFPIDFWIMQNSRSVLYGEDILKDVVITKKALLWQLCHEVKGLRMRIKQQYWRTAGDVRFAGANLIADYSTILILSKVLLFLKGIPAQGTAERILQSAKHELAIADTSIEAIMMIKKGAVKLKKENIRGLYTGLMEYVRALDESAANITV